MIRLICFCSLFFFSAVRAQSDLNALFNKLCKALQVPTDKQPKLVIRKAGGSGASYSRQNHTIYLEQKLVDAFSSLGGQKDAGLAFVLGHELCHALEKDKHDTHFLAYDKAIGTNYRIEQNADIQGAFVAYLTGYNCLPVMSEAMEIIYQVYQLNDQLSGYPSKGERIESVELVREQVASLITLFKSANLLVLIGHHNIAAELYKRIHNYFPSPEVQNNMGANLILEGLNLGKFKTLKYALPIEIAWELRLRKPDMPSGQKDFEPEIIRKREILFRRAEILYKDLLIQHPQYFPAWTNLVCLKLAQEDIKGASLMLLEISNRFKGKEYSDMLQLLRGTLYLLENKSNNARSTFKSILNPGLKQLANQNLSQVNRNPVEIPFCSIQIPLSDKLGAALLQEKTIRFDSLVVTWSRELITIQAPGFKKTFRSVEILPKQIAACHPNRGFYSGGMIWNDSLMSIPDPVNRKEAFYTVN